MHLFSEPEPLRRVSGHHAAHWFVVAAVCVGAFMGQLDASIVTLALPTLRRDFGVGLGAVEWVALSYLLVLVALVTMVGRLADMVGRKSLYLHGFGIFVIGSALCGLAPTLEFLVAARALQAIGAALLQANSIALIVHATPRDRLGRGIGVQGAAQAMGLALGPVVGGALLGAGGWRLIFLVNVPVGIVGILLGRLLLPRSEGLSGRQAFDWTGAALFVPAVGGLMGALSSGHDQGLRSPLFLALGSASVILGAAFVAHERRTCSPLIDLRLFRRVHFSAGIASGLLSYLVMFGVLFLVPFYLELWRRMGTVKAGLTLSVLPLALGVVAPLGGRLADRVGARRVTAGGMVVTAIGLVGLGFMHQGPALVVELAWIGAGIGAFTPANNAAIMASAPVAQAGVAGGILNMTRGVGTSLGVAATGLVYGLAGGVTVRGALPGTGRSVVHGFDVATLFLSILAVTAAGLALLRGRIMFRPSLAAAAGVGDVILGGAGAPARVVRRLRTRVERRAEQTWGELERAGLWLAGTGLLVAGLGLVAFQGEPRPHAAFRTLEGVGDLCAILGLGVLIGGVLHLRRASRDPDRRLLLAAGAGLVALLLAALTAAAVVVGLGVGLD